MSEEAFLDDLDEALGDVHLKETPRLTKTSLVQPDEELDKALTALVDSLLVEGNGESLYTIGVGEGEVSGLSAEDIDKAISNLIRICNTFDAAVSEIRRRSEDGGDVVEVLLRKRCTGADFNEVRIAVVGNVDAGKSTLLGVLTHGVLDNGRGLSRQKLFRHQHELDSGRTSSVAHDILGFGPQGEVVNKPGHDGRLDWVQVCTDASKVATFIDLAGHERYLKTTVFGLTGHVPHFAMLMVGSNAGVVGMAKEHLGLALALNVPVYVVVTKIDMCPPNILESTLKLLQKILKSPGCRKIPLLVSNMDDVVVAATNFISQRVCPIFQVSNVTGQNLDLLRSFINLLNSKSPACDDEPVEFQIDDTFSVPGVGTVVSGTNLRGTVRVNDVLALGPDTLGNFQQVVVKGIHRRRMPAQEVRSSQTCSFALKKVKRSAIRKGMVMVAPSLNPTATWEFEGEILVLHHPTTISVKYEAVIHCGSIRQTASIIGMDKQHIRTGDKTVARFRFVRSPEYLQPGARLIFREGRTKAVGTVLKLIS
eukprot:TRINITY_DN8563_c0_g1_i4.p1 TRINITY_DN8563_c0_g1~~TRINITY_DN8563_c0_g1_i4.p1  ORF type:complete len:537 (+),score=112.89 TRINITY_DN8563_c0_g1_i4:65-1675(+)